METSLLIVLLLITTAGVLALPALLRVLRQRRIRRALKQPLWIDFTADSRTMSDE